MTDITKLTPEELEEFNRQNEAELKGDLEGMQQEKADKASSALSLLMDVTASETIEIAFEAKGKKATLEIMANPPQKILTELFQTAQKAEKLALAEIAPDKDIKRTEDRFIEILEYLTVHPKIPKDVWMSGELSDEIAARIIFELMKYKVQKREAMREDIESFRQNKRRSQDIGNMRVTQASAVKVGGVEG